MAEEEARQKLAGVSYDAVQNCALPSDPLPAMAYAPAARSVSAPHAASFAPQRVRRCRLHRAPAAASAGAPAAEELSLLGQRVGALVAWCVERGACGDGLEVSPGGPGGRGRGLVASRDISAGETLLTLPLSMGIVDEPAGHPASAAEALQRSPWFARLAARLLQEHTAGAESPYAPYMRLLPTRVDSSPLLCDAQLAALCAAYPPLADEAAEMRRDVADAYTRLAQEAPAALAGASAAQFADAVSVVYSRAYGMRAAQAGGGGRGVFRVLLPLADMINHGSDEGAADGPLFPPVRDAANVAWDIEQIEDESAPSGRGHAMSVTALKPLSAGDEALFSYREQSNDHFLLYYGFVPRLNSHDDVVLFDAMADALTWHDAAFPACAARRAAAQDAAAAMEAAVRGGSDAAALDAEPRLKLLAGTRPDGRLMAAFAALHRDSGGEQAGADRGAREALHRRCGEVLAALGDDARGDDAQQPAQQALAHKRRILREALTTLAEQP